MQDYDDFKVGDKVWCACRGAGEVIDTLNTRNYNVVVKLEDGDIETYTKDGRLHTHYKNRSLFFSEPKVEGAVKLKRPFTPTLIGKNILIDHEVVGIITFTVSGETNDYIENGTLRYKKEYIRSIYELVEKLK